MLRLLFSAGAAASGVSGAAVAALATAIASSVQYSCSHCGAEPFIGRVCTLACAHPFICVCRCICVWTWCCAVHNEMCENPPPKQNVFLVNFVRLLPAPFPCSLAALLWYGVCCAAVTAAKPYRSPCGGTVCGALWPLYLLRFSFEFSLPLLFDSECCAHHVYV